MQQTNLFLLLLVLFHEISRQFVILEEEEEQKGGVPVRVRVPDVHAVRRRLSRPVAVRVALLAGPHALVRGFVELVAEVAARGALRDASRYKQ